MAKVSLSEEKRQELGRYIRELRLRRKLSQKDLGRLAGMSQQAISYIETGQWEMSFSYALRLARPLGLSPRTLCARLIRKLDDADNAA